ncbi:hypothetical protein ACFQFG_26680 [Methylobacterium persicinum]
MIGAAVGFGYYDLGLIPALSNFLVLALLTPLKRKPRTAASQDRGAGTEPGEGRPARAGPGTANDAPGIGSQREPVRPWRACRAQIR